MGEIPINQLFFTNDFSGTRRHTTCGSRSIGGITPGLEILLFLDLPSVHAPRVSSIIDNLAVHSVVISFLHCGERKSEDDDILSL